MSPLFNDKCWAPRQKLEQKYELDGSILIFKTKKNHKIKLYIKRSSCFKYKDVIEIDDFEDLYFARFKLKKRIKIMTYKSPKCKYFKYSFELKRKMLLL